MITLCCAGIGCLEEIEVELPEGWTSKSYIEDDEIFCPKCQYLEVWLSAQCPGCVNGWGECGLWKEAFSEDFGKKIDLQKIRDGYCPYRVNGTMSFCVDNSGIGRMEILDISERPSKEICEKLATVIEERIKNNDV